MRLKKRIRRWIVDGEVIAELTLNRQQERKIDASSKRMLRSYSPQRERDNKCQATIRKMHRSDSEYREKEKKSDALSKRRLRSYSLQRERDNICQANFKRTRRLDGEYREEEKKNDTLSKRRLRSYSSQRERDNICQASIKKLRRSDSEYREKEKKSDTSSKRRLRSYSLQRERDNIRQASINKLHRSDSEYRDKERKSDASRKQCLRSYSPYRKKENDYGRQYKEKQRIKKTEMEMDISFVGKKFKECIQKGPVHVCTCCKRMLYRHSVVHVPADRYTKNKVNRTLISKCLTGYVSAMNSEWICTTCHKAIKSGRMPAQAEANMLKVEEQPFELSDLSPLEERLISRRIPFMQIVNLPRGSQKGIKGPAVNVPSSLNDVISLLARLPSDCGLVPVKLKRKLTYKGHVMYQSIRPENVMAAITYLKENHDQYKDIEINSSWIENSFREDFELAKCVIEGYEDSDSDSDCGDSDEKLLGPGQQFVKPETGTESKTSADAKHSIPRKENRSEYGSAGIREQHISNEEGEDEEDNNVKLRGIPFNTCLQPSTLPYTGKEIFSLAPGEGQHPISFFTDSDCEILAFPALFPSGRFGFNIKDRPVHLTMRRYFNQRILNVNNRFAQNTEYLFFAQYLCEAKQVLDNISIAMRKGAGKQLTAGYLCNSNDIENDLKRKDGFRFLQNVRGSYPYWVKTLHDLNAMVRQLDIPTWLCSFSAADLKWPETIQIIAQQQGQLLSDQDVEDMDWQQKYYWLRSNPVTAAKHFEFRVTKFLREVLMSHAEPLGKIIDYFLRTEFQQRGSPHVHCLFWVEGAPKIGKDSDQAVCQFVDKYVQALLPGEDDGELHDLVTTLQRHSHSSTCKTSSEKCRFHFPRPPTDTTIIAAPPDNGDLDPSMINIRKEANAHILKLVQDAVVDNSDRSLDEILTDVKVTETQYMEALQESSSNPTVILQRKPWETCINNYNADLLKIWSANLDVQFVTNAYACAMYILSYVSKGERQMGELLKMASKESAKDDSIRHQMKKLGNVFFTHRELSAQEASYRLLSIPLKKCSRAVVFVNSGLPEERIRILKSLQKLQDLPPDSLDIFEVNIIDRYAARPDQLEMICLADFATMYRLKGAPETDCQGTYEDAEEEEDKQYLDRSIGKEIRLKNNLGVILKRKIRAILRSPRFSSVKSPERYFHALLMLYFPWRNEEDDLKRDCKSYESFFQTVKDTVFENQQKFENNLMNLMQQWKI